MKTPIVLIISLLVFSPHAYSKGKKKKSSEQTTSQTTEQTTDQTTDQPAAIPLGKIEINQSMVRQGVAPMLNWSIDYPTGVVDVVDITPNDEIEPKTKLQVKISMIGVGITDQRGTRYEAKSYVQFGSSGWEHLFTGTGDQVQPDSVLIDRVVRPGDNLRFAAKVNLSGYDYYYNQSSNIKVLKNGDTPPSVAAGYDDQQSVANYLRPYVKDGKIALGPMDLIYVSELTHSDPQHSGYDMQDAIVLVQFDTVAE